MIISSSAQRLIVMFDSCTVCLQNTVEDVRGHAHHLRCFCCIAITAPQSFMHDMQLLFRNLANLRVVGLTSSHKSVHFIK